MRAMQRYPRYTTTPLMQRYSVRYTSPLTLRSGVVYTTPQTLHPYYTLTLSAIFSLMLLVSHIADAASADARLLAAGLWSWAVGCWLAAGTVRPSIAGARRMSPAVDQKFFQNFCAHYTDSRFPSCTIHLHLPARLVPRRGPHDLFLAQEARNG